VAAPETPAFTPDPDTKRQALADFGTYLNPQKVRVLKAAGLDIIEAERDGAWVWDLDGRRFLDCFSSAGSFNVGRRNPRVIEAAHRALDSLDHGNFLLASKQKADLAKRLAELAPGNLNCVTFGTGGGEAVDFAIKLARGATGRHTIISTVNGYHGHTGFALSAGGRAAFREPFEPLMPDFEFVPFGDLAAIEAVIDDNTAGVILEPIQGEGGIRVAPDGYLAGVRAACDRVGALLIFDEIQTGMGRTGKWFASQHWNVVPDILTVAKSLGGSIAAISATIYTEDVREFCIPNPFIHLSTFGGSDLACAIAMEVLDVLEEDGLIENAALQGERLHAGLREISARYPDVIAETRGIGLMAGVQYREDSMGPRMSWQLSRHGVLAFYSGNEPAVMRLMPPLVVQADDIDFLLIALDAAIQDLRAGVGPEASESVKPKRRPVREAATAE
jgi:acetylornithine/succinyldiaminopimelate/putrescine aminotransferase